MLNIDSMFVKCDLFAVRKRINIERGFLLFYAKYTTCKYSHLDVSDFFRAEKSIPTSRKI